MEPERKPSRIPPVGGFVWTGRTLQGVDLRLRRLGMDGGLRAFLGVSAGFLWRGRRPTAARPEEDLRD